jgi:putative transcriptional regulator
MPIVAKLDEILARRKMTAKDLGQRIGISQTQLSLFRSGKIRGVRFSTLSAMCAVLQCRPGDLLDYEFDPLDLSNRTDFEGLR